MAGLITGFAALLAVLLYAMIVRRIQLRHASEWERLGSPGILHDPTQSSSLRLAEFVWRGSWVRLHDLHLSLLCGAFFLSVALMVGSFAVALLF